MKEREVTDSIALIASRDPAIRRGLLRVLLQRASRGTGKPSRHAYDLLRRLPRTRLDLINQYYIEHVPTVRDIGRDLAGGRRMPDWSHIDWMFQGDAVAIAVEVKINRRTRFQIEQLEKYHRALQLDPALQGRDRGLLALVKRPPDRADLVKRWRRPFNLGFVLWDDVISDLQLLSPHAAEACGVGGAGRDT